MLNRISWIFWLPGVLIESSVEADDLDLLLFSRLLKK